MYFVILQTMVIFLTISDGESSNIIGYDGGSSSSCSDWFTDHLNLDEHEAVNTPSAVFEPRQVSILAVRLQLNSGLPWG